ncbi:hypothetical protein [Bacillus cereus]|uniref:hypothetical protein n=1 Tax=Bacillus cereus TaxID=1396 RepID=UPI001483A9A3|nr:hypothetical protein [Bacillus cereus]
MHFRLRLLIEYSQKTIKFYEEILGLAFLKKNETRAMVKLEDFALILTPDYILNEKIQ